MNKLIGYIIGLLSNNGVELEDLNEKLKRYIKRDQNIYSTLISYKGIMVFEEYFNNCTRSSSIEIKSITKSILSLLIGILIEEENINIEEKVMSFFPDMRTIIQDERIYHITLKHLLTMTSGIEYESGLGKLKEFKNLKQPIKSYLGRPLKHDPGKVFNYSEIDTHLLSVFLHRITGVNALEYGKKVLFRTLGIEKILWKSDSNGDNYGGSELSMTPCDLLKIGKLYLNKGIYKSQKIVDSEWIVQSTSTHSVGGEPVRESYGYLWWTKKMINYDSYFAYGYGGQILYMIPEAEIVIQIGKYYKE